MLVKEITLNLSIFLPVPQSTISNYLYDTLVQPSSHLLKLKGSHYSSHDELVNNMFSEYIKKTIPNKIFNVNSLSHKRNLELEY